MRLVLVSSSDGYLARGPEDDMKWSGHLDKAIFRLLTLSNGEDVLLAGSRTFDQLPKLPGRRLERVSRSPNGVTLEVAAAQWPTAWLIGGPEISIEALRLGLITRAFICISPNELGDGISAQALSALLPHDDAKFTIKVGDVHVKIFTEDQKWPSRGNVDVKGVS